MFKRDASIDRETLLDLLQQLGRYQTGGVSPTDALTILKAGPRRAGSKRFLQTLQDSAEKTQGFAEGLAQYPRTFYPFLTDLLWVAEKEARGSAMLAQCVAFLEGITVLDRPGRNALKRVTYYPFIMAFFLFLLISMMLIFVIPTFEDFFHSFGAELPDLTRGVIALSGWFSHYWWGVVGGILLVPILWRSAKDRWPVLAPLSGRFWRQVPVVGGIYIHIALMRFLRTVAFMRTANQSLPDALAAAAVVVDPPYAQALHRVRTHVLGGQSLAEALRKETLFSPPIIAAAAVGERTQNLAAVFDVLADQHQRQLQSPLLARSIEVILMVLLAVTVGLFVIAMYLPIFKLGSPL